MKLEVAVNVGVALAICATAVCGYGWYSERRERIALDQRVESLAHDEVFAEARIESVIRRVKALEALVERLQPTR